MSRLRRPCNSSMPLPRLKSAIPRSDCAPVRGSGVNRPLLDEGYSSDGSFPGVDGEKFVSRSGQRLGSVPGKIGRAVDLPVDDPAPTSDGEMVGPPEDDRRLRAFAIARGLDRLVVFAQAADDAFAVVPATEDDHVAGRIVAALVGIE